MDVSIPPAPRRIHSAADGDARAAIPLHPVFFAAFPVMALYARNVAAAGLIEIGRPLAMTFGLCGVVWAASALLVHSSRKAALVASAVTLAYFSYGHLLSVLPGPLRPLLAPVGVLLLVAVGVLAARTRQSLAGVTSGLNLASVVLLVPSAWTIASTLIAAPHGPRSSRTLAAAPPSMLRPKGSPNLPDVYYIILDAYGREDSLRAYYGFDNTPFLRELERRGFYIAQKSRSNYDQTGLCIASALNMRYLDGMENSIPAGEGVEEALRQSIDRSEVSARLRKAGYGYVYIDSGIELSRADSADLKLGEAAKRVPESPIEQQFMELARFDRPNVVRHRDYARHRGYIVSALDNLASAGSLPGPKFVFAHIFAPHPPFVLGPNGEPRDPSYMYSHADASWLLRMISRPEYKSGYISQLQYVNKRILEALDAIQRSSRRPSIIVIQGDHGSRMNLDWDSLAKTDVREPFSILNAYCVPKTVRASLYDTITPVNTFRLILSDLKLGKLDRLPDRSAYSTATHPLEFTDVTSRLDPAVMPAPSVALPAPPPLAAGATR